MRIIIYVRQSLDKAGDGQAVARQEAECRRLCEQRGWEVAEVITENDTSASGKKPRPGFERLMEMAQNKQMDCIVVWHADRLVRRPIELERVINVCETAGVKLVTVGGDLDLSSDQGRLNARVIVAFARAEMERKSARHKLANEQRAKAGVPMKRSKRAFGYSLDNLTLVDDEANAIREACRYIQLGGSVRGIVREWTAKGLQPPQGAERWVTQAVRAIILNPRISGMSTYKGDVVADGQWPAIVDKATFNEVHAILTNPARRPPKGTRTLLSGIATCVCGRVVYAGRTHHARQVYKCAVYFNSGSTEGSHTSRGADLVNDFIRDLVVARLSQDDAKELLVNDETENAEEMQDELILLAGQLDELAVMFAKREITASQLATGSAALRADISSIEAKLADTKKVNVLGELILAEDVRKVWDGLDLDRQRAVVGTLLEITLHPVGQGTRTWRPETVEIIWK